jgi:hypothetical protein
MCSYSRGESLRAGPRRRSATRPRSYRRGDDPWMCACKQGSGVCVAARCLCLIDPIGTIKAPVPSILVQGDPSDFSLFFGYFQFFPFTSKPANDKGAGISIDRICLRHFAFHVYGQSCRWCAPKCMNSGSPRSGAITFCIFVLREHPCISLIQNQVT